MIHLGAPSLWPIDRYGRSATPTNVCLKSLGVTPKSGPDRFFLFPSIAIIREATMIPSSRRRLLAWLGCFFASVFLIISCSSPQASSPNNPSSSAGNSANSNSPTVRIGFSVWPGWVPWQVSQDAQLFADHKINVDLKWFDGYLDSINALNAGQLDGNSQTLNDTISS